MKTKKLLVALLVAVLACGMLLAGCGSKKTEGSDLEYIKGKGKLIVGITDFEPIDFKNDKGEWVGFDADMAKAFAEKLGVKVEFVEIDWDNKAMELDAKNIDVVWNGMTLTKEVQELMACSNAYCNNGQVVVSKKGDELGNDAVYAVESGSAGEATAQEKGFRTKAVSAQSDALLEVKSGTSQAAVVDLLMASAMVGEGKTYADMAYGEPLTDEEYVVGCRKGSDLVNEVNTFFQEAYKDGTMKKVADQYELGALVVEQK